MRGNDYSKFKPFATAIDLFFFWKKTKNMLTICAMNFYFVNLLLRVTIIAKECVIVQGTKHLFQKHLEYSWSIRSSCLL